MLYKDYLFEIGVEEIPAGFLSEAVHYLNSHFRQGLEKARLEYSTLRIFTTPRRLTVMISHLAEKEPDEEIEKIGPNVDLAYDSSGKLTPAAQGFLRSTHNDPDDIYRISSPKGEKIAIKIIRKGRQVSEILALLSQELLKQYPFPKTMIWSSRDLSFARPIRWLLALWGDDILPLNIAGLRSGRSSFGNRHIALETEIVINHITDYEMELAQSRVIADREVRRSMIINQLKELFADSEEKILADDNLTETITDLVEYPTAVIGSFSSEFLNLPKLIITSTLSQHQKYYAVVNAAGDLINKFVFISNGDPGCSEIIRLGNEKVVKARLEDAEFYYHEDLKQPLESFVEKLRDVTFQAQLGNLYEKTERIKQLASRIADQLDCCQETCELLNRAAYLCKADLVTMMLGEKEFTKLQGYIGWQYATVSGEPDPVPRALYEHYLPRWQGDDLPESLIGSILAISDKMDTVCGIFGVNLIPTGSRDPFALRRAANGIVQILAAKHLDLNLKILIDLSFELLADKLPLPDNNIELVYEFFRQRVNWLLKEMKVDYDIINSVMHIDHEHIPDLVNRARALQELKPDPDFIKLVIGFKRVSNIIETATDLPDIDPALFSETAEINLYNKFKVAAKTIEHHLNTKSYDLVLSDLVSCRLEIDAFFDQVLVNVDEDKIRLNRYALLSGIRELFLKVADISKIVIDNH